SVSRPLPHTNTRPATRSVVSAPVVHPEQLVPNRVVPVPSMDNHIQMASSMANSIGPVASVSLPALETKVQELMRDLLSDIQTLSSTTKSDKCSLCMESAVNAVIYKCGHMCMCFECAVKIKASGQGCPICRKPIK
ncbi:hypothetical protein PENTCL1PPCAC_10497, partial [Pristionchus entomophagus]